MFASQFLSLLHHKALLGRGPGTPKADPHEPVHHVHVRQHHLNLPHYDGLHDGLEANPGSYVHVCQWVLKKSISNETKYWCIFVLHSSGILIIPFCSILAFKLLESSSQQWLQGLVYLIGNLLGSALAIYKCQSMGLLPTHSSDWLAFIEPPQVSLWVPYHFCFVFDVNESIHTYIQSMNGFVFITGNFLISQKCFRI